MKTFEYQNGDGAWRSGVRGEKRAETAVLFINAREQYVKGKRQNQLTDDHIDRIVSTYRDRPWKPIDRYARRVSMDEIEKNEFNLNISQHVSTGEDEAESDFAVANKKVIEIEREFRAAKEKHKEDLKEHGLDLLP